MTDGHPLATAASTREHAPIPSLLATVGRAPPPDPRRHAHQVSASSSRSAEPREVHHFAAAHRLRRRRREPLPGARDAQRLCARRHDAQAGRLQDGGEELHQGAAQGRAQGHVEDGHLHAAELPRRPDLRGRRPAPGLRRRVLQPGRPRRIGGIGIEELEAETRSRHTHAYPKRLVAGQLDLKVGGIYQWRRDGEYHMYNPDTIALLQYATRTSNFKSFQQFTDLIDHESRRLCTIRGLLDFKAGNADPDRRGRAGQRDRQALRHRRRLPRLDQPRGARDHGHRHEPHRRPQQHRRGRRGLQPLQARRQRRLAARARSSRSPPAASA